MPPGNRQLRGTQRTLVTAQTQRLQTHLGEGDRGRHGAHDVREGAADEVPVPEEAHVAGGQVQVHGHEAVRGGGLCGVGGTLRATHGHEAARGEAPGGGGRLPDRAWGKQDTGAGWVVGGSPGRVREESCGRRVKGTGWCRQWAQDNSQGVWDAMHSRKEAQG